MSDNDSSVSSANVPPATNARPTARNHAWIWLVATLAALVLGYLAWRVFLIEQGRDRFAQTAGADLQRVSTQVEALARGVEQARRDAEAVRSRLDDTAKVNQSLREQLLGLTERARLVEEAVTNLADKRLSAHDALLLNEGELLLALGGERYSLFHDADAAIAAYRLADGVFAEMDDAAFSTVRQSVSAEIDALGALHAANIPALLDRLATLRAGVAQLPLARNNLAAPEPTGSESHWWQVFGQFVRIRTGDAVQDLPSRHDATLARELLALDLREAEAALLIRDSAHFAAALNAARAALTADFDATTAPVTSAMAALDDLSKQAIAPPPPAVLGAALKELRNLRATHALQEQAHPAPTTKPGVEHEAGQS